MAAESSAPQSPNTRAQVPRWQSRLPPVLSAIAGMVDVIGLLDFKLFTAHITGNLVVLAALLVRGGPPNLAQLLAIPVFAIAVAFVWLLAKELKKRGRVSAKPLLLVQFLLLVCVLVVSVIYSPAENQGSISAIITPLIAVSAMACQFALLRLTVPSAPSTAVMTGNLTNAVLSLLDTVSRGDPLIKGASERLKKTLAVLIGFFAGCVAGAAAVSWLGDWAWSFPVILAAVALLVV
jgi:uncharacterized membrane protein YoaK (UPF0700 family)